MSGSAKQTGLSLISMMVGLLISLLAVLLAMTVYKLVIGVSVNGIGTSQRDGQRASALLATQIELQQAGYGIERTVGPVDMDTSLLHLTTEPAQAVWRFRPDLTTDTCAGVRVVAAGTSAGLWWLPPKSCSSAATATWAEADLQPLASQAVFFVPRARDDSALAETGVANLGDPQLRFYPLPASEGCTLPYAQQAFASTDERQVAQRLVLRDGTGAVLLSACLSNFVIATESGESP